MIFTWSSTNELVGCSGYIELKIFTKTSTVSCHIAGKIGPTFDGSIVEKTKTF